MPGSTRPLLGNGLFGQIVKNDTLTGATSSATSFNQTITLVGVRPGDQVNVFPPSIVTGVCVGAVIAGIDSITVQWMNTTGGSVTTVSASVTAPYTFHIRRSENQYPSGIGKAIV